MKVVYPKTLNNWFLPTAFTTPAPYTYGNARRNSLVGPGRTNFDTSLFKTFPIHEQIVLQFRIEAFNVFNHPQFGYPNQTVGNSQVGQITSIVGNARNLQALAPAPVLVRQILGERRASPRIRKQRG